MPDTTGMWAIVSTEDNLRYEGTVNSEQSHGIYLHIAGDTERLVLFPWGVVNTVVYKR